MIEVTTDQYKEMLHDGGGYCRSCKQKQWGVEPDARNVECEHCGQNRVFGIEELLVEGSLMICDSDD